MRHAPPTARASARPRRRVYALLTCDAFILVPNVAGLGLFALQLLVYRWHAPFCGPADVDVEAPEGSPKRTAGREGLLCDQDHEGANSAPGQEPLVSPIADTEVGGDSGDGGGSSSGHK